MTKKNLSKEITAEQFIDQYLKKIGVGGSVKPEQFWRLLSKRFGKLADEFGDCVEARENGQKVDPYVLKNQTVEFANAIEQHNKDRRELDKTITEEALRQIQDLNENRREVLHRAAIHISSLDSSSNHTGYS